MKQIILIFSCFLFFGNILFSQTSQNLNFQSILRNAANDLVVNTPVTLRFQILETSDSGPIVYEETHSTSTDIIGVITAKIGGGTSTIGDISTIDWSTGAYFLSVGLDPDAGNSFTLLQTTKLNSVPISITSSTSETALTADYDNLTNKPTTRSVGQGDKIDFIEVSSAIDLNATKAEVDVNTAKISFPDFGTTAGTALEVLWTKIGSDVFYNSGTVGIGTNTDLDTSEASLAVNGGILFEGFPFGTTNQEIGTLKFATFPAFPDIEDFYFGNNNNINTTFESGSGGDIVMLSDAIIPNRLGVGESMTPSYNLDGNNLVLASSTPTIKFDDTSNSSSFPSGDWRISINDIADGGESFFGIDYLNQDKSMFKISADAPSSSFTILGNGNVGLSVETPTEKLEMGNTLVANNFIGNASGLTNLTGLGTTSTTNSGSTTIGADNDANNVGRIIFETQNQNQMVILPNGNLGIGVVNPSITLDVDGNLKATNIETEVLSVGGALIQPVTFETPTNFVQFDVTEKSIIIMNPTSPISVFGFISNENQKITLINSGTSTVSFLTGIAFTSGTTSIVLNPNESITLIRNGNNFNLLIFSLIKA